MNYFKKIILRVVALLCLLSLNQFCFGQFVISGDIRGVYCQGGLGLCGNIEVTSAMQKNAENKYSEFNLVLNNQLITPSSFTYSPGSTVTFELKENITLDDQTMITNNLDLNKKTVLKGFYPVTFDSGSFKVRFILNQI